MNDKSREKRDSLTELENFIDSYAAVPDVPVESDTTAHMVNILREQMLMNLSLMSSMNMNGQPPLMPKLGPLPQGGPPLMPLMMPPLNPVLGNPLMPPTNLRPTSPIISPFSNLPNPFLQNLPQAKDEPDNGAFPTVMIPGIGPCMMIPTVMNEDVPPVGRKNSFTLADRRMSAEISANIPSDINRRRHSASMLKLDQKNDRKYSDKRRSGSKDDMQVLVKSSVKSPVKELSDSKPTKRVIRIKEPENREVKDIRIVREVRKAETDSDSDDDKPNKRVGVKGGHEVYIQPHRRASESAVDIPVSTKPLKSILKKAKSTPLPPTPLPQLLEKLGTDDEELPNVAKLIVQKAVNNSKQAKRLVAICANLISQKPKFRYHLLKALQEYHSNRQELRENDRKLFIGCAALIVEVYLTLRTSEGNSFTILINPIKQIIVETINDADFNADEAKFLGVVMIRLGPQLSEDDPEALEILMATTRAVSIHVRSLCPKTRKYLLRIVEYYANCWNELNDTTSEYFSDI